MRPQPTFINATILVLITLIGVTLMLMLIPNDMRRQSVSAIQEFDHTNCKYPHRWSNPPQACDNSSPAVPECIKAMATQETEQACIANFVKQYEQPTPSEPVTTTPASDEQKTYTCGGK